MNLFEFQKQLEEKSVTKDTTMLDVTNCRREDGAWVLPDLMQRLGIFGHSKSYKGSQISAIIRAEREKRVFTSETPGAAKNADGFELVCTKNSSFQPYEVTFKVNSEVTDKKFKELLKRAKEEFCSTADWLLNPILKAVGE